MSFDLYIREVPGKGRGLFTSKNIPKGAVIEVCPVIVLTPKDTALIKKTLLNNYIFSWLGPKQLSSVACEKWSCSCLALGNGSLINHAKKANTYSYIRRNKNVLVVVAKRAITANEELTHDYGWPKSHKTKLPES